jgi:hypothetical protein
MNCEKSRTIFCHLLRVFHLYNNFMDITRNWRLKTSNSKLIGTYWPETGAVVLAQQNGAIAAEIDLFDFNKQPIEGGNGHKPAENVGKGYTEMATNSKERSLG